MLMALNDPVEVAVQRFQRLADNSGKVCLKPRDDADEELVVCIGQA